jgi:hypothetical protein
MLNDLAALAPPLVMCAGFILAVAAFVRHEVRRGKREGAADAPGRISGSPPIASQADAPGGAASAENGAGTDHGSSAEHGCGGSHDPGSTDQDKLRST